MPKKRVNYFVSSNQYEKEVRLEETSEVQLSKQSNEKYKEAANAHWHFKEFAKGDNVIVFLKKEIFPKRAYTYCTPGKFAMDPGRILKKQVRILMWWNY